MVQVLKRLSRREISLILLSIALVIIQVALDLKIPSYMSAITQLVISEGSEMEEIFRAGALMLLCAVLSMLATFGSGFVSARLSATYSRHMRSDIFRKVMTFSSEEIDRFSTASLITRSTNDVTQIQSFVSGGFTMIIRTPITVTIALMKISGKHWQWTVLTSIAVAIVMSVVIYVILVAQPKFRRMQALTDDLNRVTRENLTGIRVIRAYNAEPYQEQKFSESNDTLTDNHMSAQRNMSMMQPVMRFVNNGLNIGIYLIGGFIISSCIGTAEALTTFSDMVVFSNYASRILFSFMSLRMIFNQLPRVTVCAQRVNEILDTDLHVKDSTLTEGDRAKKGEIEFRHVSFRYPDSETDVIHDISFSAKKGEVVAFIGATGSGKTSLISLIPRFFDTTEGDILIDGKNVKEYSLRSLRNKIGYAPQHAVLFTGTVRSNVSYGELPPSYRESQTFLEVKKAIEIAQSTAFVERMENGYDAFIARGGANVSGGQKQRLSIARAIFRKPEFYIFDDTFSALDYKTDRALRAALREQTAGVTTLIVAQRIGTIRDADRIIVLDEGEVAGMGTHSELLKSCPVYREIAYTQMSKEELENG